MEQTFEEYLKQARWDFAKVAEKYPVENHLELRTAIDSLLIAYDQAAHQALSLGAVVGQSEQLNCDHEWKVEAFNCYGMPYEQYCEHCGKKEAI